MSGKNSLAPDEGRKPCCGVPGVLPEVDWLVGVAGALTAGDRGEAGVCGVCGVWEGALVTRYDGVLGGLEPLPVEPVDPVEPLPFCTLAPLAPSG